jgi:Spy/CpxP family protein refolding chaperone
MRRVVFALVVLIVSTATSYTQTPYAGQEKRQIKALSAEEIDAYLGGEGMGLAKAAELNRFPGPKHVLELASQLQLSEKQITETKKIFDAMRGEATRVGQLIVEKEKGLDRLFAQKQIDSRKLRAVVNEIARLQGNLRAAHLQAHLHMERLLSTTQIEKYEELRGYKNGGEHNPRKHHGDQ